MTRSPTATSSRPHFFYAVGVGILMLASIVGSNVPDLAFSRHLELAFRKEICAGLFLFGAALGCWALLRHVARTARPWQVAQSQVSWPYLVFFVSTLTAIVIAH